MILDTEQGKEQNLRLTTVLHSQFPELASPTFHNSDAVL